MSPDKLVFCDDFDDGGVAAWKQDDSDKQSVYGLSDAGVSAPFAAAAGIAPGPDMSADARYSRASPSADRYAGIEATGLVRIIEGDPDPRNGADLVNVRFGKDVVFLKSTGVARRRSTLADGGITMALFPLGDAGTVPRGDWLPFRIRLDHGAKAGEVAIGQATVRVQLLDDDATSAFTVAIGPGEVPSGPGWSILYDDIVVRSLP